MDEQLSQQVDHLQRLLDDLVARHGELLHLMKQKHAVLRRGDAAGMTHLCQVEHEKLQAINDLEAQRANVVAALTEALDPTASEPLGMAALAERLEEPARGRLPAQRQALKQRMEQVREQTSITRRATESLMQHVNGLVRTVTSLAANAATYDRAGGAPTAGHTVRTLNVSA